MFGQSFIVLFIFTVLEKKKKMTQPVDLKQILLSMFC